MNSWENAARNANPECRKCHGTGHYMYDRNHGTICNECCQHNMGWWKLQYHYGKDNGKWCCLAGCGKTLERIPVRQAIAGHARHQIKVLIWTLDWKLRHLLASVSARWTCHKASVLAASAQSKKSNSGGICQTKSAFRSGKH